MATAPSTRRGRCVSLFGGFGGLDLGVEQAGFDINVSVDIEPVNAATHEYLFSYGKSLTLDLMEDQTAALRKALPHGEDVDVITMGRSPDCIIGGPPCQGLSSIGTRDVNDPRNQLLHRFVEHGIRLAAKTMILENVPPLLQPQNRRHVDGIREALHRAGYSMVEPRIVRAIDFGVPQRRERVFLLIHRNDVPAPSYPLPTHGEHDDLLLRPTPRVRDAFDGLPDADNHPELWDRHWAEVGPMMPTGRYGRLMAGLENDPDDLSYRRPFRRDIMTCSQLTVHEAKSVERFLATAPGGSEPISRRHRLDPDGLSLTLRAGSGNDHGAFTAVVPIAPKGTRVITPREAARLHSIPDWVTLSATKIWAYRQIGNSVAPAVGAAITREVAKALNLAPPAPTDVVPFGDESLLYAANDKGRRARRAA